MTDGDGERQLHRRLAEVRRSRGLLQRDVAKAMGVPQSRVGHIETGGRNLTVATLARYVAACGGELALYAVLEDAEGSIRVRLL